MSTINIQYQVFYAKPWRLTDEKTGEIKTGVKICYGENSYIDESGFRGMPVTTKSISNSLAEKLTKLPAKYDVALRAKPASKGGMDFEMIDFKLAA